MRDGDTGFVSNQSKAESESDSSDVTQNKKRKAKTMKRDESVHHPIESW